MRSLDRTLLNRSAVADGQDGRRELQVQRSPADMTTAMDGSTTHEVAKTADASLTTGSPASNQERPLASSELRAR
jgi:hypothetical protein